MHKSVIGTSDVNVMPLVFGGNVFGWTADERTSFSILDAFVDHGLNFVDTADVYSAWVDGHQGGESETIIGKWFKESGKHDKIVLATKVGMLSTRAGLSAANIAAAVDDSLRRLKTDYIDVYFSHLDNDKTPLEENQKLVKAGKVRVIGASNYSGERLAEALDVSKKAGCQPIRSFSPNTTSTTAKRMKAALNPSSKRTRSPWSLVLQPRERLPVRQIPFESRHAGQGTRIAR